MVVINADQVVSQFQLLLTQVKGGEEFSIRDDSGTVIARLAPPQSKMLRISGLDAGSVRVADDFNAPLPDDILRGFEGDSP